MSEYFTDQAPGRRLERLASEDLQRLMCNNGHDTFKLLMLHENEDTPFPTFASICVTCGWMSSDGKQPINGRPQH